MSFETKNIEPLMLIVDLFCGFGGTTTGFEQAEFDGKKIAKVIACVNHDPKAIKSHWLNHPDVKHFEEDIRTLDLTELSMHVKSWQHLYPEAKLILWASLECTNFSKAKGGQPRDADSRTLAEHLYRYVQMLKPHFIKIENVVEFMSWGPLNDQGKPISRKNGQDFMQWRNEMCNFGYRDDWKEMNSADYGAYTSRNRLFGCFAKDELPIIWPEPTHSKNPSKFSMHGDLQKWKAVKEVLNFEDEGESIFVLKKPLCDKTLERIYAGLLRYVAKGDTSFISKYYSGRPADKNISTDGPAGTITCADGQALVQTEFLLKYNSTDKNGKHTPPSVEEPCPVVSCQGRLGLVQTQFLAHYYGNGFCTSVNEPCPTLRTKDGATLIDTEFLELQSAETKFFIDKHFGTAQNQSIDQPAGSILPKDKHRLVEVTPFIMSTNFNNRPTSIEQPCGTITANRKHHYILNPSVGNNTSTEKPCPVIIARQDKAPLYLVQAEKGTVRVEVYECDTPISIKIKEFMVIYSLVDIKMRMLRVLELLKIQGFPAHYKMEGNQSEQKKFIGNSVVPQVPKAWAEVLAQRMGSRTAKTA